MAITDVAFILLAQVPGIGGVNDEEFLFRAGILSYVLIPDEFGVIYLPS